MRKFTIPCILLSCFLGACSSSGLAPVSAPTNSEVTGFVAELRNDTKAIDGLTPREFMTASIIYSNQKCDEFFDSLARFQRDSSFGDQILTAALAAGTPLYPIYGVSQTAQTIFTTAITGVQTINGSLRDIYAFAPYSVELRRLIKEAQARFLSDRGVNKAIFIVNTYSVGAAQAGLSGSDEGIVQLPPEFSFVIGNINHVTRDEAFLMARYVAQAYAQQCSISSINSLLRSSIERADIVVTQSGRALAEPTIRAQ